MEGVPAQGNTIKKGSKMSKLDVVEIWKELHRMPEPGMNEFKTGARISCRRTLPA